MTKIIIAMLAAIHVAGAVVLWRSPDPDYRFDSWLAAGKFKKHDPLITEIADSSGLDPRLLKAVVWRESKFRHDKHGGAGERGLMQVGESAARDWAAAKRLETFMFTDLFDARTNLQVGSWYLARAMERWKDRDDPIPFALAEYNAGLSRVRVWAGENKSAAEMVAACDIASTRRYVDDIVRRYQFYKANPNE